MRWRRSILASAFVAAVVAEPAAAGQVRLEIRDGRVTLEAKDATLREVLAEWARVGKTRVVNAERAAGGVMTLQLDGVPEQRALEILLRSTAGFLAAPRAVSDSAASVFDRIMIMPGPRPAAGAAVAASPASTASPARPPFVQARPVFPAPGTATDDQDEPLPTASMPFPGAPTGASQPGMATPSPQPAPYGGAGMTPNPPPPPNAPAGQPFTNPYGTPYGNPYTQTPPGTTGANPASPPMPNSAPRPGMPTAPIGPIKN